MVLGIDPGGREDPLTQRAVVEEPRHGDADGARERIQFLHADLGSQTRLDPVERGLREDARLRYDIALAHRDALSLRTDTPAHLTHVHCILLSN